MSIKKRLTCVALIALFVALSLFLIQRPTHTEKDAEIANLGEELSPQSPPPPITTPKNEAGEVAETQKVELYDILKPVCACESVGNPTKEPKHFDENGNVIRGKVNPQDIGACQINLTAHQKTLDKMGLDAFNEQDNIIYANYLYDTQGLTPWSWSKNCWFNYVK